jgi:hypothetical protein
MGNKGTHRPHARAEKFLTAGRYIRSPRKGERKMDINELWHNGNEADWKKALQHYWDRLSNYPEETRLIEEKLSPSMEEPHKSKILQRIQQCNKQQWYDFLHDEYFPWTIVLKSANLEKYNNPTGLDKLLQIRNELLQVNRSDISQSLSLVCEINGCKTMGASGLLSLMYPDDFGAVDQNVVKSLRQISGLPEHDEVEKIKTPKSLELKEGVMLIQISRAKADENNCKFSNTYWTPRAIDQILTTFGR